MKRVPSDSTVAPEFHLMSTLSHLQNAQGQAENGRAPWEGV